MTLTHQPSRKHSPWRVYHAGKSYWFATEGEAEAKLAELQRGVPSSRLTAREVDEWMRAKELLKGTPLLHAVRYFIDHHPVDARTKLLTEAAEEFHRDCDAKLPRPKTAAGRRHFLKPLLAPLGDKWVAEITRQDVEKVLAGVLGRLDKPKVHARNNTLRIIRQFFGWAKDRGYVASDPTGEAGRRIEFLPTKAPKGIITAEQLGLFLVVALREAPELVPALALQTWAGVRSAEVERMVWGDVVYERQVVVVREEAAKTGEERVIDWWPEAFDVWLRRPADAQASTPIARPGYLQRKRHFLNACRRAGIDLEQNALRHSYATYGCAFWQSSDRMKLLMGQRSADIFFINYRKWASQEDGIRYFSGICCPLGEIPLGNGLSRMA